MSQKKILITLVDLHFGGISNLILQTSPELKKYFNIHIIYFGPNKDMLQRFNAAGLAPLRIPYEGGKDTLRAALELRKFIVENSVDVVSTHFTPDKLIVGICRLFIDFKIVSTIHNVSTVNNNSLRGRYESYFHNKMSDKVFAVSKAALNCAKQFRNLHNSKSVVLYNAVQELDVCRGDSRKTGNTVFITACRFNAIKGLENLIDIFNVFNNNHTKWMLLLVGTGELFDQIKARVSFYSLEDKIFFLGFQENLAPLYEKADFYINSSKNEALSLSIIEAMSSGLPILASNVGGIPEVVQHHKNGFLIDFSNDSEPIKYLKMAYNIEPKLYREFSKNSRKIFKEKFSVHSFTIKMKEEIDSLFQN